MSRTMLRELRVGLILLVALAGLVGLLVLASVGPGFLGPRRTLEIVFKDGQGVRAGCPVRVAGIDAGRVLGVELYEAEEGLRVKIRISMPVDVADRLKQDVRIAIVPGLTGQSMVNVIGSGKSKVALVPGQVIQGVETSMFDPILEQIGMGAGERKNLQETIGEIRETITTVAPRLRTTLTSLSDTSNDVRVLLANIRPRIEATAEEVEGLVKGVDDTKIDTILTRVANLTTQVDGLVSRTEPALTGTLKGVQSLAVEMQSLAHDNRPQLDSMVTRLNESSARLETVLANSEVVSDQAVSMLTQNRADVERTLANVRDATGTGLKLVQKLYGNPFYLSPFYKPRPEDIVAQEMYDSANSFLLGSKEFHDALKTLQSMQGKAMTKREQEAYNRLFTRAWDMTGQLNTMQKQLADQIRTNTPVRR